MEEKNEQDQPKENEIDQNEVSPLVDKEKIFGEDTKSVKSVLTHGSIDERDNWCWILFIHAFLFVGKAMRVYFQICEIYFCLIILCFLINFILVLFYYQEDSVIRLIAKAICLLGVAVFFCNPLTMTFWEFSKLNWLKDNPFISLGKLWNIPQKTFTNSYWVDSFLVLFLFLYLVFGVLYSITGFSGIDYYHCVILFTPSAIKYLFLYLTYICMAIYSFIYFKFPKDNIVRTIYMNLVNTNDADEEDKREIPEDPFVISMFRNTRIFVRGEKSEEPTQVFGISGELMFLVVKIITSVVFLAYIIIDFVKFKLGFKGIFLSLILWLVSSLYAVSIIMPVWFTVIFEKGYKCCCCCKGKIEDVVFTGSSSSFKMAKDIQKIKGFTRFMYINSFFYFLGGFILLVILLMLSTLQDSTFYDIEKTSTWDGLSHLHETPKPKSNKTKNSMCSTKIHDLNLLQIGALAAFTYYDNDTTNHNTHKKDVGSTRDYLVNSFFRDSIDSGINITYFDFISDSDDQAVILKTNIDFPDSSQHDRNVTVYAIRGSTTGGDWKADFEMFSSSALLSIMRMIPLIPLPETISARFFSRIMTLPIEAMVSSTSTYHYTSGLLEIINKDIAKSKEKRDIIVTGHSLGGGLSKIVGINLGVQSVAYSGPGITPLEYLFRGEGIGPYFKSTFIDIIPDKDIVPRFEVSGGIRYRLLCAFGITSCHNILSSLCMMGIICEEEFYTEDFCRGIWSKSDYNKMKKVESSVES